MKSKGSGYKRRLVEAEDIMVYVPLLETLSVMLHNDNVLTEVSCEHTVHKCQMHTLQDIVTVAGLPVNCFDLICTMT